MPIKFFVLLKEFSNKPTTQVGKICKSISAIKTAGVLVPEAICIPLKTLENIVNDNDLIEKIYKLIQTANLDDRSSRNKIINKIKNLIIKQKIPKDFSREFLEIYHGYLKSDFVLVQSSNTINGTAVAIKNIKGDANVIDVFLEVDRKSVV